MDQSVALASFSTLGGSGSSAKSHTLSSLLYWCARFHIVQLSVLQVADSAVQIALVQLGTGVYSGAVAHIIGDFSEREFIAF